MTTVKPRQLIVSALCRLASVRAMAGALSYGRMLDFNSVMLIRVRQRGSDRLSSSGSPNRGGGPSPIPAGPMVMERPRLRGLRGA